VSDFYFVIQDQECGLLYAIYTWRSDINYCIKRLTVRVNRCHAKVLYPKMAYSQVFIVSRQWQIWPSFSRHTIYMKK